MSKVLERKSPGLLSGVSPSPSTALQTLEYEFANDSFDSATDSPLSTIPDNGASNYKRARSPTITKMIDRSLRKRRTSSHKRLEKTAVGLRELARKIGEVDVKYGEDPPTNVLFACKLGDSSINHCIFAAVQFMISQNKVNTVFLQDQMFDQLEPPLKETLRKSYLMCSSKDPDSSDSDSTKKQLVLWQSEDFSRYSKEIELILSFGGDGTVLFASWLFQEKVPPIIPFNMGSLGFLTVFDSTSVEEVVNDNLANDKGIRMNLRMRFSCTIQRKDALKGDHQSCYQVLNDLVVDRGPSPFLSNLELFGNDSHLTTVQADGLVIATPTGSTAYSLSAGGSVVHPDVSAILVTPICPHSLSFRPMILPDTMDIKILVPEDSRSTAWVSFDGRKRVHLEAGDAIHIQSSEYPVPTICKISQNQDWFLGLERCLAWNKRSARQKILKA